MENSSFVTLINTLLLSLSSSAILVIRYFLVDIYQDYKKQIEKTNLMHTELSMHVKLFQELKQLYQKRLEDLNHKVAQLEQEWAALKEKDQ